MEEQDDDDHNQQSIIFERKKGETSEERRARKHAVKEIRKVKLKLFLKKNVLFYFSGSPNY
jgi:hypothetical protein